MKIEWILLNRRNLELSTDEMRLTGSFSILIFDGFPVFAQEKNIAGSIRDTKVLNEKYLVVDTTDNVSVKLLKRLKIRSYLACFHIYIQIIVRIKS